MMEYDVPNSVVAYRVFIVIQNMPNVPQLEGSVLWGLTGLNEHLPGPLELLLPELSM